MSHLVAAEGGYQAFHLGGGEWFWLVFAGVSALLALAVGYGLMRGVLAADQGTPTTLRCASTYRCLVVALLPM